MASIPHPLVQQTPPAFIKTVFGQLVNVERSSDLDRGGQHRVEHFAVRTREI